MTLTVVALFAGSGLAQTGGVTPASTTHGSRGARTACLTQPGLQTGATYSDVATPSGNQLAAENFVADELVEIDVLKFWGGYYPNDITQEPDTFTVIFRQDDTGLPGAEISRSTHVGPPRLLSGYLATMGVNEYEYTIDLTPDVALGPGTFWVEIYNDTTGNSDSWVWAWGALDPTAGVSGAAVTITIPEPPWQALQRDLALEITCASAPLNYEIPWHTIDGGGETFSEGEGYKLGGTIGQADAGFMSGDGYVLGGGFWAPTVCSTALHCDDGDECTVVDTCDPADPGAGVDGCLHEYQEQVFGDVVPSFCPPTCPQPDADDIICLLDDFRDGSTVDGCGTNDPAESTDLAPCGGDGVLDLDDILYVLDAFAQVYPCPHPCP